MPRATPRRSKPPKASFAPVNLSSKGAIAWATRSGIARLAFATGGAEPVGAVCAPAHAAGPGAAVSNASDKRNGNRLVGAGRKAPRRRPAGSTSLTVMSCMSRRVGTIVTAEQLQRIDRISRLGSLDDRAARLVLDQQLLHHQRRPPVRGLTSVRPTEIGIRACTRAASAFDTCVSRLIAIGPRARRANSRPAAQAPNRPRVNTSVTSAKATRRNRLRFPRRRRKKRPSALLQPNWPFTRSQMIVGEIHQAFRLPPFAGLRREQTVL